MQKTKKPRKKSAPTPTVSVEQQLALALSDKPIAKTIEPGELRVPIVGDKVMLGTSESVFTITRANPNSRDVDLQLPGTNIERFRVSVGDLKFVDAPQASPRKPTRPAINVEEINERLIMAQHSSVEQFSGDIAVLKKYLKSKGVNSEAAEELDSLCEDMEKRWSAAIRAISDLLERF